MATVGIIGGGVGGLTAALALSRCGFDVGVFEKSNREAMRGAALLLWSNAMRALRSIGLEDEVLARGAPVEETEFRTFRGTLLTNLPVAQWSARAGAPTVAVRRAALLDLLEANLPTSVIHSGTSFVSYERDRAGLRVLFEDGKTRSFDVLIGADGLRSAVRAQLRGVEAPRVLGYDAWVGVAHAATIAGVPRVSTATIGEGPRFWAATLRDGAVFWYATLPRRGAPPRDREELAAIYREWPRWIGELIAATPSADLFQTQVCDRPPADSWGAGAVSLLGDAAHPSTPDLGQGACQAIESAVVLARVLAASRALEDGLRAYERERMARTAAISRLCWMTSTNSTLEDPTLCRIRDAAMKWGLQRAANSSLEWILGGGPG